MKNKLPKTKKEMEITCVLSRTDTNRTNYQKRNIQKKPQYFH